MKKMMLGLVVGAMMLAMVGCGNNATDTKEEIVVVETEVQEDVTVGTEVTGGIIDGLTGERVQEVKEEVEETIVLFSEVCGVVENYECEEDEINRFSVMFKFEFGGNPLILSNYFPEGTFEEGDIVKIELPYSNEQIIGYDIISWEKVEE
jgi:hypothetical protein